MFPKAETQNFYHHKRRKEKSKKRVLLLMNVISGPTWGCKEFLAVARGKYSNISSVENGTLQGNACSPMLFNIMIKYIFEKVEEIAGKLLYADNGHCGFRGVS